MNSFAIEANALEKTYTIGDDELIAALTGVDLTIANGEIYALLGPNGAGKTTTVSILSTLVTPTAGAARVAGFDVVTEADEVRRRVGITFQEMVLDEDLTGREILDFHGRLYGQSKADRAQRIDELAQMVELEDALNRKASGYSGGMKRRLELIRGLMTYPQVLFLDEPTQGLDPQNRAGIWEYIRRLRKETGLTLLLTTHYMDEAETLCDRVGIIDGGKLVVEGPPDQLIKQMGADVVTACGPGDAGTLADSLRDQSYVSHVVHHSADPDGATLEEVERVATAQAAESEAVETGGQNQSPQWCLQIGVDDGARRLVEIVGLAPEEGVTISSINVSRPTLADVFLAHTGHALRDT